MKSEHINIARVADGVEVVADDYELFDYLDDLFSENSLQADWTHTAERDGKRRYVMHFGKSVPEARIFEILNELPEEEVERIWQLNNNAAQT
jgi:hypothetical protein